MTLIVLSTFVWVDIFSFRLTPASLALWDEFLQLIATDGGIRAITALQVRVLPKWAIHYLKFKKLFLTFIAVKYGRGYSYFEKGFLEE